LAAQPDHQTERLFDGLFLGCLAGSFLRLRHQRVIDLNIGAQGGGRSAGYVYSRMVAYTLRRCNGR
jgi:hypothetical protein